MPYSAIFRAYFRTNTTSSLVMSVRPTTTAHLRAPKTLKPSLLTAFMRQRPAGIKNSHGPRLICSAIQVDWRVRHRSLPIPFWDQQSSSYGRFAYQDDSSDESDRELGSSQQQLVSLRLAHYVEFNFFPLVLWHFVEFGNFLWPLQVFIGFRSYNCVEFSFHKNRKWLFFFYYFSSIC